MFKYSLSVLLICFSLSVFSQDKLIVEEYEDGTPKAIILIEGKGKKKEKVGEEYYRADGTLEYTTSFEDGKENGMRKYYFENGEIQATEEVKNGELHGEVLEYRPDGKLWKKSVYKNGKKKEVVEY